MLLLQMLGYYRIRKSMVSLHERTKPWAFMNGTKYRLSYWLLYNKLRPPWCSVICVLERSTYRGIAARGGFPLADVKRWIQNSQTVEPLLQTVLGCWVEARRRRKKLDVVIAANIGIVCVYD